MSPSLEPLLLLRRGRASSPLPTAVESVSSSSFLLLLSRADFATSTVLVYLARGEYHALLHWCAALRPCRRRPLQRPSRRSSSSSSSPFHVAFPLRSFRCTARSTVILHLTRSAVSSCSSRPLHLSRTSLPSRICPHHLAPSPSLCLSLSLSLFILYTPCCSLSLSLPSSRAGHRWLLLRAFFLTHSCRLFLLSSHLSLPPLFHFYTLFPWRSFLRSFCLVYSLSLSLCYYFISLFFFFFFIVDVVVAVVAVVVVVFLFPFSLRFFLSRVQLARSFTP